MPSKKYKVIAASNWTQLEDKLNELDEHYFFLNMTSHEGWLIATFELQEL